MVSYFEILIALTGLIAKIKHILGLKFVLIVVKILNYLAISFLNKLCEWAFF